MGEPLFRVLGRKKRGGAVGTVQSGKHVASGGKSCCHSKGKQTTLEFVRFAPKSTGKTFRELPNREAFLTGKVIAMGENRNGMSFAGFDLGKIQICRRKKSGPDKGSKAKLVFQTVPQQHNIEPRWHPNLRVSKNVKGAKIGQQQRPGPPPGVLSRGNLANASGERHSCVVSVCFAYLGSWTNTRMGWPV